MVSGVVQGIPIQSEREEFALKFPVENLISKLKNITEFSLALNRFNQVLRALKEEGHFLFEHTRLVEAGSLNRDAKSQSW
jgi:hypothetical protein